MTNAEPGITPIFDIEEDGHQSSSTLDEPSALSNSNSRLAPFDQSPTADLDRQQQSFLNLLQRVSELLAEQNQALAEFDRRLGELASQLNSLKNHY